MTKVKLIEIDSTKLTPGAKYVFAISPIYSSSYEVFHEEMDRLIGRENYTALLMDAEHLKVFEVMPEDR